MRSFITLAYRKPPSQSVAKQQGITLIVALVLLVVVSLAAGVSIQGSTKSEQTANNARSQELAWQAAEGALRYYEIGVTNSFRATNTSLFPSFTLTVSDYTITAAPAVVGSDPLWRTTTSWDGSPTQAVTVPLHKLDNALAASATPGISRTTARFEAVYQRSPECIAQFAGTAPPGSRMIFVTCRGFGPEVAAGSGPPGGAEVFLQSTLDFN